MDDFRWLKSAPSPNWRLLPESEYVDESVWTDLVPGEAVHRLADVLRAVGVVDER